jgi:hypothetical protein
MRRPLTRAYAHLSCLALAAGLATTPGLPAAAATAPTGPRVSLAEAVAVLPAPGDLPPGNVTEFAENTVARPTGINPCNLAMARPFALHDNGAAIGVYSTPVDSSVFQLASWVVATRVFASPAAAHSAISRLVTVEKSCPGLTKVKDAGGTTSYERTWSARYVTASGWHGYHTVDVIRVSGRHYALRHIAVYLQRGNALISVDEIATVVGHNSDQQEARRLAVQHALATKVSAAAAS